MIKKQDRNALRAKRHLRNRKHISGTAERPRLNVYRSLEHIYVQLIDDVKGHTLVAASTLEPGLREKAEELSKLDAAKLVGEAAGRKAKEMGISRVVFDRGGYLYTGRVAMVAQGARDAGLDF